MLEQGCGLVAEPQGLRQCLALAPLGEQRRETPSDAGGEDEFGQAAGAIAQQGAPDALRRRQIRRDQLPAAGRALDEQTLIAQYAGKPAKEWTAGLLDVLGMRE